MTPKERQKHKIEVIYLKKIISLNHSFRDEFTKFKNQHCIEIYYSNDQILYLACYDSEQIKQWQTYIKKAINFYEWITNLQDFLAKDQDKLTEQVIFKLNEIIQFMEQYNQIEKHVIQFIDQQTALLKDKKRNLLLQQSIL